MPPIEITQSRLKSLGQIAGAAVFAALGVFNLTGGSGRAGGPIVGGLILAAALPTAAWAAAAMFRPRILRIDEAGFSLSGGIGVEPVSRTWDETGPFEVVPRGRNTDGIAYTPILGHDPTDARPFDARSRGRERDFPAGWSQSPQAVVDLLNSYRAHANRSA